MDQQRLQRLERKVNNLTWMARLQTVLLALIAVVYLLRTSSILLLLLLVVLPLLVVFRRSVPQWARRFGALWAYSQRQGVKESKVRQRSVSELD